MRSIGLLCALAALLLFPLPVLAAQAAQPGAPAKTVPAARPAPAAVWNIDPDHSSVNFTVRHIFAKIPGRFAAFSGTIRFDPENLAGSAIEVAITSASVDTHVAKRDDHLRTPEFFDAARYPVITFSSRNIVHKGGDSYAAQGTLTIKDVSKEFTLPFTYLGQEKNPLDQAKTVAGFEALFPITLLDYHLGDGKWQKLGAMGDTADVALYMELLR